MNALSDLVIALFTQPPHTFLSWPAVAMILGWLVLVCSPRAGAVLAITPRTPGGLVGIVTAPFVHANGAHLAANLPPFVVLGWLVLARKESQFLETTILIALLQGCLLWLLGRRGAHVGLSGVIFGFLGWLLGVAWFTQATMDVVVAAGVLIVYGGMLWGVAPLRKSSSWEGHLFGLIAGFGLAWYVSLGWLTKQFLFRSLSLP
jgi:membrane associated rhomboid family serine protease